MVCVESVEGQCSVVAFLEPVTVVNHGEDSDPDWDYNKDAAAVSIAIDGGRPGAKHICEVI